MSGEEIEMEVVNLCEAQEGPDHGSGGPKTPTPPLNRDVGEARGQRRGLDNSPTRQIREEVLQGTRNLLEGVKVPPRPTKFPRTRFACSCCEDAGTIRVRRQAPGSSHKTASVYACLCAKGEALPAIVPRYFEAFGQAPSGPVEDLTG